MSLFDDKRYVLDDGIYTLAFFPIIIKKIQIDCDKKEEIKKDCDKKEDIKKDCDKKDCEKTSCQ